MLLLSGAGFGHAAAEYLDDGQPTPREEQIRWLVNRARHAPVRENLIQQTTYDVVAGPLPPLAPARRLMLASRRHSEDLARTATFQHETPTGSAYYPAGAFPWQRVSAEGYEWNGMGENIAAGYADGAAAHRGWWHSDGHRQNLLTASWRELGVGCFDLPGSPYHHYDTEDFATPRIHAVFFTDTAFADRDGNGEYDEGEGIGGVEVRLRVAGQDHPDFDRSTACGSFAVPCNLLSVGSEVLVLLGNPRAESLTLTLPSDRESLRAWSLAPGSETVIGSFVVPPQPRNFGFRDLQSVIVSGPALVIRPIPGARLIELAWPIAYPACQLLFTTDPGPAARWFEVDVTAEPHENEWRVTLPIPGAARFYRLNCP